MCKNLENTEFYLGPGFLGGFEIIEHNEWDSEGSGACCFDINGEDQMSDGDGFPAHYDSSYVRITEKDFLLVKDMFYNAGETMCEFGENNGKPLERPLAADDYLYSDGVYVHIHHISDDRENYWGQYLIYDSYSLYSDLDNDLLTDSNKMFEKEELENEYMIIPEQTFHQALNFAKTAITEITAYLRTLYNSKN